MPAAQVLTILPPYLDFIRLGVKQVEGRVNTPKRRLLRSGQTICLQSPDAAILCRIDYLNVYPDFRHMLEGESIARMLPQFCDVGRERLREQARASLIEGFSFDPRWPQTRRLVEGVKVYQGFPGADRVQDMGAVAIGIEYLTDIEPSD